MNLLRDRDKAVLAVAREDMIWGKDITNDKAMEALQPHQPLLEKYYRIADAVLSAIKPSNAPVKHQFKDVHDKGLGNAHVECSCGVTVFVTTHAPAGLWGSGESKMLHLLEVLVAQTGQPTCSAG